MVLEEQLEFEFYKEIERGIEERARRIRGLKVTMGGFIAGAVFAGLAYGLDYKGESLEEVLHGTMGILAWFGAWGPINYMVEKRKSYSK